MKVWVLSRGERCEGSSVLGVYTTVARGLAELRTELDGKGWASDNEGRDASIVAYYTDGCDYVELTVWTVDE